MITIQTFKLQSGYTRQGIVSMPTLAPGEKCGLIWFSHGMGEAGLNDGAGNGATGNESLLYKNGSPLQIATTGYFDKVVDPVTGKSCKFAVVGLQGIRSNNADPGTGWCCYANENIFVLKQFLVDHPEIDTALVMPTGLSAGGGTTWDMLNSADGGMFVAGAPLSASGMSAGITNWTGKAIVYVMHASNDPRTSWADDNNHVLAVNSLAPGMALLETTTTYHGGWDIIYNPNHLIPGTTFNIYQLALQKRSNPAYRFGASTTVIKPTTMIAAAKISITAGVATLDTTPSTGAIASYRWDVNYPYPSTGFPQFPNGSQNSSTLGVMTVKNIQPNYSYVFTLTVWDAVGNSATAKFPISTDASANGIVSGTVVGSTKKIKNITVNYLDGTSEIVTQV